MRTDHRRLLSLASFFSIRLVWEVRVQPEQPRFLTVRVIKRPMYIADAATMTPTMIHCSVMMVSL
jgi:hypothetical protein